MTNGKRLRINAGTTIAFDGTEHRELRNGTVILDGDRIAYVGKGYDGPPADRVIDAPDGILIPGQISTHAHVGAQDASRLLIDGGRYEFIRSGFLHFLPSWRDGRPSVFANQDLRASLEFGFLALLRHGVTSVVAFAPAGPDEGRTMLEVADRMGIRLFWAPIATGGRYWMDERGMATPELDEKAGIEQLEATAGFIEKMRSDGLERVTGMLTIDEFYLSTPGLRRHAKMLADSLGVGLTMHFLEQHREFFETVSSTGKTPVQLLAEEGVLGKNLLLAHCLYLSHHSKIGFPIVDDLALLGEAGVSVSHSPVAFSRRGLALESFDRYQRAGINMSMGTDTYPLDMFGEMRIGAVMCKHAEGHYQAGRAEDLFRASNVGGAKALGREDLGRIAEGAKADLVLLDSRNLAYGSNPDPVRGIVHLGHPGMVDTVIVDGRILVEAGEARVADEERVLEAVDRSSRSVWAGYTGYDWEGLSSSERFPPALRPWEEVQ